MKATPFIDVAVRHVLRAGHYRRKEALRKAWAGGYSAGYRDGTQGNPRRSSWWPAVGPGDE